jgi:hypothetical protein
MSTTVEVKAVLGAIDLVGKAEISRKESAELVAAPTVPVAFEASASAVPITVKNAHTKIRIGFESIDVLHDGDLNKALLPECALCSASASLTLPNRVWVD